MAAVNTHLLVGMVAKDLEALLMERPEKQMAALLQPVEMEVPGKLAMQEQPVAPTLVRPELPAADLRPVEMMPADLPVAEVMVEAMLAEPIAVPTVSPRIVQLSPSS
jgi:hypothetical protein